MLLFIFGVLALVIGRVLPALSQLARLIEVVSTVANSSEREARKKERENEKERKAAKKTLHFLIAFLRSKKETFKREHTLFRSRANLQNASLKNLKFEINLVEQEFERKKKAETRSREKEQSTRSIVDGMRQCGQFI